VIIVFLWAAYRPTLQLQSIGGHDGVGATLTSANFAMHSRRRATAWITDSEYVFGSDVYFHNGKMMTQTDVEEWSIFNAYENLR